MNEVTYILPVACYNCDWSGNLTLEKGVPFEQNIFAPKLDTKNQCPNCGCSTLSKRSIPKWNGDDKYIMRDLGNDRVLCFIGNEKEKLSVGA